MTTESDLYLLGDREIIDLAVDEDPASLSKDAIDVDAIESTTRALPQPQQQNDNEKEKSSDSKKNDAQEERRKRRRMMRRMLKPGAKPSFLALVTPIVEEEEEVVAPKRIRIDVDEYLGLKKKKPSPEAVPSSNAGSTLALPTDEGWFEGCIPLSLPGEESLLPELQALIRSNLEIFSATEADVRAPQPGRRTPIVRGKVGIRCIHCAKAIRQKPSLPWPKASVSYPVNILGLYPSCMQKPQVHFQNCPHMPVEIKEQLDWLMNDDTVRRTRKAAPSSERHMSTVLYYTIAAKMIGLVDVAGGIRFGRDLALDPLPMETVRAQIEDTHAPYNRSTGYSQAKPPPVLSTEPRITADVESERVLAQAVAEKDHDLLLAKSDDKKLVTDFIFLCIKQMAICHAVESDFATRGKKTRMMRVGFAGFCCRHCVHFKPEDGVVHIVDFSCRSFSSAPDNLASAISNSFYLHVQKCPAAPMAVRNSLSAYKRLHSRQMSRLPYGSQRRMFQIIWTRLRAADLSKEEMEEKMKNMPLPPPEFLTPLSQSISRQGAAAAESSTDCVPDAIQSDSLPHHTAFGLRGPMPVCDDEETKGVLKNAEDNWDPIVNDNLILPSDRNLVSDFVFLMMRQLKAAHPTQVDFAGGKRTTITDAFQTGVKCIHCMDKAPSHFFKSAVGRSFPSAPDNMASTLNSSMFQHLQKCPHVKEEIKRALVNLKSIHSAQCASLRFGSQRRFFNLVFERLEKAPDDEVDVPFEVKHNDAASPEQPPVPSFGVEDVVIAQCGFVETANGCFECQFCRMVPFALRARDSVSTGRPLNEFVRAHQQVCKKDAFDLSGAVDLLKGAIEVYPALRDGMLVDLPLFGKAIQAALGDDEDMSRALMAGLKQAMSDTQKCTDGGNQPNSVGLRGLWNRLPSSVEGVPVKEAFREFALSVAPEVNPDLFREPHFLQFFRTISPSLMLIEPAVNDTKQ